jgi:Putative Ig domain
MSSLTVPIPPDLGPPCRARNTGRGTVPPTRPAGLPSVGSDGCLSLRWLPVGVGRRRPKPSRSPSSHRRRWSSPPKTVGEFYCCGNLFASGGVPTYARSVVSGELPPGLELPRRENTISGTPTAAGTFTFTVQVTDERGTTAEKEFTITVS